MKKALSVDLKAAVFGLGLLLSSSPSATDPRMASKGSKEPPTAEDFMVVDCLLPGKVRRLGRQTTYLTPRRPLRTTALDCQIRGGEYTEFDRSSYSSALRVWLDEAKAGNAEAQYYVGQIYEKGLGLDPDYSTAAQWYTKSADQDYSAAQISLGYLFEMGLGVNQDSTQALTWYRKASGLPEEMIVLEGAEYEDLVGMKTQLEEKNRQIERLQAELSQMQTEIDQQRKQGRDTDQLQDQVQRLQSELESQRQAASQFQTQISGLQQTQKQLATPTPDPQVAVTPPKNLKFGPYNALVIGNRNYQSLQSLDDAIVDAEAIAKVLTELYGFSVQELFDATRYDILSRLNTLREELTEEHNLLIYYVGHSVRDRDTQRSWWQPVDAEPDSRTNWISTRVMNDHLDLIPAKHVLVVADAAYSGFLTRSSVPRLPQGMSREKRFDYIRQILAKRSRLVMASGEGPSSFSAAFQDVLGSNVEVVEASMIYRQLVERLSESGVSDVPEFAPLRWARSEGGGDFFFVPKQEPGPSGP